MHQNHDILSEFSASALANAIEANQLEYLADLARSPHVEFHDGPELTWLVTGIPHPRFNRILRARFEPGDIDAKIEAALAHFKSRAVPVLWHTGPGTRPANLGPRLTAHGLARTAHEPGMAVDLLALGDDPCLPPTLTVEPVRDLDALKRWSYIFARAFGSPDWTGDEIFQIEASLGPGHNPARRHYLGRLQGEPMATSSMFLGAGVAGLYAVGTLPHARRQGIGRAMTLAPLLEARARGYRIATLHASPSGLRIYRQLGFRAYCRLSRYMWTGETSLSSPNPGFRDLPCNREPLCEDKSQLGRGYFHLSLPYRTT